MSVNSATMQISGGIASLIAGMIVTQSPSGMLEHYAELGYVVVGSMGIMIVMMYYIDRMISGRIDTAQSQITLRDSVGGAESIGQGEPVSAVLEM